MVDMEVKADLAGRLRQLHVGTAGVGGGCGRRGRSGQQRRALAAGCAQDLQAGEPHASTALQALDATDTDSG